MKSKELKQARFNIFDQLHEHAWFGKKIQQLKPGTKDMLVDFLEREGDLPLGDFEHAVNRLVFTGITQFQSNLACDILININSISMTVCLLLGTTLGFSPRRMKRIRKSATPPNIERTRLVMDISIPKILIGIITFR